MNSTTASTASLRMTLQLLSKCKGYLLEILRKRFDSNSIKYLLYKRTYIVTASSRLTRDDTFSLVRAAYVRSHSVFIEIVAAVRGLRSI